MLSFKIQSDEGALNASISRLEKLKDSFEDFRPYWPAALIAAREVLAEAMDSEGGTTESGKWPDLDPSYALWKAKRFPGAKILERTGRLKADLVSGVESKVEMEPMRLSVESGVDYGGYHQLGEVPNAPRRAPWSPTRRDAAYIAAAISREIRREVFSNRPFILG
jgi:hypothetical protein